MSDVLIFAENRSFGQNDTVGIEVKSLGPFRIATEIRKKGYSCQVIFYLAEYSDSELEQICNKFIDSKTIIIGFSTLFWFTNNSKITNAINKIISVSRDINSNVKIIFGGPNSLDLIDENNFKIDAIVEGFGEHGFLSYFESVIKNNIIFDSRYKGIPLFKFVEKSSLFSFPESQTIFDKSDGLDQGEPVILEVARGCIFKCKFCAYSLTGKKKLDHVKNTDILHEELIRNYESFGIDKYILSDDTFNDSTDKLKILHKIFTSLPFKIRFATHLRLDLINAFPEQIELLYEMGLSGAFFGIETFHKQAAKSIGKGVPFDPKQLLHSLKTQHWKKDVKISLGLITGLPFETHESYAETANWILDHDNLIDTVAVSTLRINNPKTNNSLFKSEFETTPEKYGYYWPLQKKNADFYKSKWENNLHPIKSWEEAEKIRLMLHKLCVQTNRVESGGVRFISNYVITNYFQNKKTYEEQLDMSRSEYASYIRSEKFTASQKVFQSYKNKILPNNIDKN